VTGEDEGWGDWGGRGVGWQARTRGGVAGDDEGSGDWSVR
jgi:hypothetical protein